MEKNEVVEKLRELFADKLSVDIAEVTDESKIMDDLGGDSLDLVEISMEVEKEFGITVTDDNVDVEFRKSFGSIAAFVVEKCGR